MKECVPGDRIAIPGSAPQHDRNEVWSPLTNSDQQIRATIVIRRSRAGAELVEQLLSGTLPESRGAAQQALEADPKDMGAVCAFAERCGLRILDRDAYKRTVRVEGTVADIDQAFGIELACATAPDGERYISYQGPISVPKSLACVVTAVLGLDERPVARHH